MKARPIILVVLPLALGAAGAWIWFRGSAPLPPGAAAPAPVAHHDEPAAPEAAGHHHATPGSLASTRAAAAAARNALPAVPSPARVTSSVAPGSPLIRTDDQAPRASPGAAPTPTPAEAAKLRPDATTEVRTELDAVRFMLRDFRTRMGENPVGSNAEIMRAVMGGNAARAYLGPPSGQSLNAEGELVDRWGTPYFFHQLAKDSMEIRSAGPDQRMWTSDDVITK